ncbi:hypothetical protein [Streptacidiphilus sp. N1-5]|uniref:Acetyltransferase n=1 Tax=Streptacidiphilus cavernicola TaxID=3342716 RepID=A0ABV6UNN9_9ACTN
MSEYKPMSFHLVADDTPSFRVLEKLGFERHHVSVDDRGELVWLTRTLP